MQDGIPTPIGEGQEVWGSGWPESYHRYEAAFKEHLEIDDSNVRQVADAVDPEVPNDNSLDDAKSFLGELVPSPEESSNAGSDDGKSGTS
ncbi:hypothetical protein [Rhizobium sp. BR 314]|uniref:hypothetical protein n=1 Tax=Rhizobium sp. BR 314 TaxID=3040013 RepID=UPI0039BF0B50